jgi:hypothetical protein
VLTAGSTYTGQRPHMSGHENTWNPKRPTHRACVCSIGNPEGAGAIPCQSSKPAGTGVSLHQRPTPRTYWSLGAMYIWLALQAVANPQTSCAPQTTVNPQQPEGRQTDAYNPLTACKLRTTLYSSGHLWWDGLQGLSPTYMLSAMSGVVDVMTAPVPSGSAVYIRGIAVYGP